MNRNYIRINNPRIPLWIIPHHHLIALSSVLQINDIQKLLDRFSKPRQRTDDPIEHWRFQSYARHIIRFHVGKRASDLVESREQHRKFLWSTLSFVPPSVILIFFRKNQHVTPYLPILYPTKTLGQIRQTSHDITKFDQTLRRAFKNFLYSVYSILQNPSKKNQYNRARTKNFY